MLDWLQADRSTKVDENGGVGADPGLAQRSVNGQPEPVRRAADNQ
jgi:hypothetical protein